MQRNCYLCYLVSSGYYLQWLRTFRCNGRDVGNRGRICTCGSQHLFVLCGVWKENNQRIFYGVEQSPSELKGWLLNSLYFWIVQHSTISVDSLVEFFSDMRLM
uniref:Uncharacterized protein n=1 Tax=Davidia involucrata TaxID=16924 RepID=A0A5B7BYS3_DAVIN